MLGWRFRYDTVPKIEYETPAGHCVENFVNAPIERIATSDQQQGIEITLGNHAASSNLLHNA